MTEEKARGRVAELVGVEACRRLDHLADLVLAENERQNLIGGSTVAHLWARHMLDSLQLLPLATGADGPWVDIGTGGGFPGLAIAAAVLRPVVLVEPRRGRAEFLQRAAETLGLNHVTVRQAKIEAVDDVAAAVISARAVAPVEKLLQAAQRCATPRTRWLFLRGRVTHEERDRWIQARIMFHVEQSLTDPASAVVVVTGAGGRP